MTEKFKPTSIDEHLKVVDGVREEAMALDNEEVGEPDVPMKVYLDEVRTMVVAMWQYFTFLAAVGFTEAMARALELPLEEFAKIALKSTKEIPMNAQCAVFAESEVVSLIHAKMLKEDISRAVHDAIAERIISMVRRVGLEKDVVLIGGMARNPGFVDAMKRDLGMDVLVPEDPEYVGALGAAVAAATGIYAVEVTGQIVAKPE